MGKKNISLIILALFLLLSVGFNIYQFVLQNSNRSNVGSACGSAMIEKFNSALLSDNFSEDDQKNIISSVESINNHQKDINCQVILFDTYMISANSDKVKEVSKKIVELYKQGENPDIKISSIPTFSTIENYANYEGDINFSQEGRG